MLSIIVPTLNEEKWLPRLLESIKKQSLEDYEVVVADAGSKDRTVEIAKDAGCRVIAGGLPAKGRNEGARVAQGDLLLFLDTDNFLPEGSLKKLLEEFEKRKLDAAGCLVMPLGNEKIPKLIYDLTYNLAARLLEKFIPIPIGFFLAKKKFHQKIGGYNEEIKLGEDLDYTKRVARISRFGILKSTKVFYSQRRFKKEGYLKVILKHFLSGLYTVFIGGIKSNIFKYKFGHYDKNNK